MAKVPIVAIVDDDGPVRLSVSALVRSLGYTARTFSSADEFLASSRFDDVDCIVTDVQMPGRSGIDLQKEIIARKHSRPIIFITAFPEDDVKEQALKLGAQCFLSKPYDGGELVRCIERAVAGGKP